MLRHFLCREHILAFFPRLVLIGMLSELVIHTLLTGNYQDSHRDACWKKCALCGEFHVQNITHNPSPLTMRFILLSLLTADKTPQGSGYAGGILPEHECCYLLFYLILSCKCCVQLCSCHLVEDQSKPKYICSDHVELSVIMVRKGYFILTQFLVFLLCNYFAH